MNLYPIFAQGFGITSILALVFTVAFSIFLIASMWRLFEKAGQPGWAIFIPIYNTIILLKIIQKPTWHILFCLIPGVNLILGAYWLYMFFRYYGAGLPTAIAGVVLPWIVAPYLGFGPGEYVGFDSDDEIDSSAVSDDNSTSTSETTTSESSEKIENSGGSDDDIDIHDESIGSDPVSF